MDVRYRYGHRPGRKRRTRIMIVVSVSLLIVGSIGSIIWLDLRQANTKSEVQGASLTVLQASDDAPNKMTIDEPTFNMELPKDWKESRRQKSVNEQSITWNSTKGNTDANRMLTIYIDIIPAKKPVNHLLPVAAQGNKLVPGDVSENCANFTQGGSVKPTDALTAKVTQARWQGVDFLCNLPRPIDHEVGTSSEGNINSVSITGPSGTHKYFFLFVDHNIQPNDSIFVDALHSFVAK